jgi:hypothetical protein
VSAGEEGEGEKGEGEEGEGEAQAQDRPQRRKDLARRYGQLPPLRPSWRFTDAETQALTPAERVAKALGLMEQRDEDRARAKEQGGESRLVGYPLEYQAELYRMLSNPRRRSRSSSGSKR